YFFPLFLPPRPSRQKGSCSPDRRLAGRSRGDAGEAPPKAPSPLIPAGAMSTRQEARRDEGDTRRRGQQAELRDGAHLSQQRRLKQATQFLHKDSADLLPLDSLKRLGTSKDLQPHSVIQRRLVEGNQSRLQGESPLVQALTHGQESRKTSRAEIPALLVNCKCGDQLLRVAVDTGTQHNQISAGCLSRLGLGKRVLEVPAGDLAPEPPTQVERLELQLGQETVACSAQVVDVESPEFCLGLQTLLSLKCCIDLERGVLRLRAPCSELPFLPSYQEPGQ
ncbi:nuclear receptor-interacting protein 2, partial [Eulemur rufifrons]|uniref:nuclear receptor-interacting protein 2 n=1 Tax=Eulemur rufifrons TaxID=859984 RepID=UPI0037442F0C